MDPFLSLANRIYEVVCGAISPAQNWGAYMFDDDFKNEEGLRNKVGSIWFHSLYDIAQAKQVDLVQIIAKADKEGWSTLVENAKQLMVFCDSAIDLVSSFSRDEQILLWDNRNQLAHSYFGARHRETIPIKCVLNGLLTKQDVPWAEYAAVQEAVYGAGKTVDEVIGPLILRAMDMNRFDYWDCVGALQRNQHKIYEMLRERRTFKVTRIAKHQ